MRVVLPRTKRVPTERNVEERVDRGREHFIVVMRPVSIAEPVQMRVCIPTHQMGYLKTMEDAKILGTIIGIEFQQKKVLSTTHDFRAPVMS